MVSNPVSSQDGDLVLCYLSSRVVDGQCPRQVTVAGGRGSTVLLNAHLGSDRSFHG